MLLRTASNWDVEFVAVSIGVGRSPEGPRAPEDVPLVWNPCDDGRLPIDGVLRCFCMSGNGTLSNNLIHFTGKTYWTSVSELGLLQIPFRLPFQ